jgi:hypothetical protein
MSLVKISKRNWHGNHVPAAEIRPGHAAFMPSKDGGRRESRMLVAPAVSCAGQNAQNAHG